MQTEPLSGMAVKPDGVICDYAADREADVPDRALQGAVSSARPMTAGRPPVVGSGRENIYRDVIGVDFRS